MTTNRNEIERYTFSQEDADAMFARTTAQALSESVARRRAAEWPTNVVEALVAAAERINDLEARVALLEAAQG